MKALTETAETRCPLITPMCTTHRKDDGRQMLDDSSFQYFSFLKKIYCCLFIFHSGLIPTYAACFPTIFKSHAFQLTTLIPQWTYSTVPHLQNIFLFSFFFTLPFFFCPPLPEADTRACIFIFWMKNSISTLKPFLRLKFCIHVGSCTKYKIEDQSERVSRTCESSKSEFSSQRWHYKTLTNPPRKAECCCPITMTLPWKILAGL